jgi:uncharacterized Fe-S center protein
MSSRVYYGSPRQARLDAKETLPIKLDLILEKLRIRERVKDQTVAIKMHTGSNVGYSTVHPVFVRRVVTAVKEGGGRPFICDISFDVKAAEERGYSADTLGCPIYPAAGPDEKYFYPHERPFKNIKTWKLAGMVQDASFLINFSHAKGHPSCGYGGAFKNLALGCMIGETRAAMHDTMQFDRYWFADACPDPALRKRIMESCPHEALVQDKKEEKEIHLHPEQCNACGRCLAVAPAGSLRIDAVNFHAFQEACAISTSISLSTFGKDKQAHIVLATQMTPVCDCFGFTSMPILPDAGILGSDDIVAADQAALDVIGRGKLIEENVPTCMEVHARQGHPLRWLHGPLKDPYLVVQYGEKLGLGTREYELVDVLPVQTVTRAGMQHISAR